MSEGIRATPVDEFSGIPLPLHPSHMAERPSRFAPDLHHAWHRRSHILLQGTGGHALRDSRIQLTNYDAHHVDYHENYDGPVLPKTDEERFKPIVLAAAEYIPDRAISFTQSGRPEVVRLNDEDRTAMWRSKMLIVERHDRVKIFLKEYVLSQDLSDASESDIDEFLSTRNQKRKHDIGYHLLALAARQAAEPVAPAYRRAYREQLIPAARARSASQFLIRSLFTSSSRGKLYQALQHQLAT